MRRLGIAVLAAALAASPAASAPRVLACAGAAEALAGVFDRHGETVAIEADGPPGSRERLVVTVNGKGDYSVFIAQAGGGIMCMVYMGTGLKSRPAGSPS